MSQLIPPFSIWLAEILAILALLLFANYSSVNRTFKRMFLFALILSVIISVFSGFIWGYGHIWNVPSALGKFFSSFVAEAMPIFLVAATYLYCQRLSFKTLSTNVISIVVGLIGVFPVIVVGVVLACLTTGDCL